jgi:glycosyltransferase involved in cell wall biosynthesis
MLVDGIGPNAGGGERMAIGLAGALQDGGHDVTVCVTRTGAGPESARSELEAKGVRVLCLERHGRIGLRGFRPLARHLREHRPDVLHAHKFGSNVWGVLFGRAFRIPAVIAHEQTWSYEGNPGRAMADSAIGRLASRFVAVSSADAERMVSHERVPERKVVVIPNAYVPRPEPEGQDLRTELGLDPATPLVGTAAVLRPQKALEVLMDAFTIVSGELPDARLVIAGKGEHGEVLRSYAAGLPTAERISFLGLREDVGNVIRGLDVVAMSSDFEGTPLFVAECMTNGAALVATRVGGIPDLIEDGVTGVLVPPRDPEALARAILDLLRDPERREQIGARARERSADLSIDRIADRFVELYREALAA